jgi:hypothetical protein
MAPPGAELHSHWRLAFDARIFTLPGDTKLKYSLAATASLASLLIVSLTLSMSASCIKASAHGPSKCESQNGQKPRDENWVQGSVEINAPPQIVWEAVHEERKHDPDLAYSKVIQEGTSESKNESKNEYKLEQKFVLVPILGTAVCQMHNKEIPFERIDYKLIKSDHFKAMEGSWVLVPQEGGKTKLELTSLLDTGLMVPRGMINSITARKIQKRLKRVKAAAEILNKKLAEHPRHLETAH